MKRALEITGHEKDGQMGTCGCYCSSLGLLSFDPPASWGSICGALTISEWKRERWKSPNLREDD